MMLDFMIRQLGSDTRDIQYVQVGANDGVLDDPVYPIASVKKWHGLLIEPVPTYFDKLVELHAGSPETKLENVAISDTVGELEIFYLNPNAEERFPDWARGCASLDKDRLLTVLAAKSTVAKDDILSKSVAVERLENVLSRHQFSGIDILIVDVEGHEAKVLRSLDFTRWCPTLVVVESNSGLEHDREIRDILSAAKYRFARIGDDIVAFSSNYPNVDPIELLKFVGFSELS